jgi:myo-inositol catabolism protein IolS
LALKYLPLSNSSIRVSNMAFGCWAIVGGFNWGPQDVKDSHEALATAFDLGITFFDTAEAYGDGLSEQLLGKVFAGKRDKIVIASKVLPEHYSPKELVRACERSLKNLKTDWIDLFQLHWPDRKYPIEDTLSILDELKQQGKIREIGLSNFGVENLQDCLQTGYSICSNQLSYNLLFRAIEYHIKPFCLKNNIGILCYSPLMQGLLTGKFKTDSEVPDDRARTRHFSGSRAQARHGEKGLEKETFSTLEQIRQIAVELGESMANISLAWLMAQVGVSSVLMSGRTARQVKQNIQSVNLDLPAEIIEKLNRVSEPLKQKLGENADMWQGGKDSRIL